MPAREGHVTATCYGGGQNHVMLTLRSHVAGTCSRYMLHRQNHNNVQTNKQLLRGMSQGHLLGNMYSGVFFFFFFLGGGGGGGVKGWGKFNSL